MSAVDPLVQELSEKKLSFRRNVVCLATELRDVRARLATQEHLCAKELNTRRVVESKVAHLQNCLLLEDQRHEDRLTRLSDQVSHLQTLLEARDLSQSHLTDQVFQIQKEIVTAVSNNDAHGELRRVLQDLDNLKRHVSAKDDEAARLRDEIRILSAHWIHKTKDLHSQLEKQRRTDQELKKKILKHEFCLQESRLQIRKLQRMGEKRDKAQKELRNQIQIAGAGAGAGAGSEEKNNFNFNFWEASGFKFMVSISMLALVIVAKR